jgi:hypothetical protein
MSSSSAPRRPSRSERIWHALHLLLDPIASQQLAGGRVPLEHAASVSCMRNHDVCWSRNNSRRRVWVGTTGGVLFTVVADAAQCYYSAVPVGD